MSTSNRESSEDARKMAEEIRRIGARAREARDERLKGIEDAGVRESLFKALER